MDQRPCPEHRADLLGQAGPTVYCYGRGHAYRDADPLDGAET
ncbi:hypothetical protein ACFQL4_20340 [Halosimplex aquaticum]